MASRELLILAADDPTGSATDSLLQYGAVGAVAVIALFAVWFLFKRETEAHDREREERLKIQGELAALNELIRDRILTQLNDSTRAVLDAHEQAVEAREDRRRSRER